VFIPSLSRVTDDHCLSSITCSTPLPSLCTASFVASDLHNLMKILLVATMLFEFTAAKWHALILSTVRGSICEKETEGKVCVFPAVTLS
jgi:hypothetical protein